MYVQGYELCILEINICILLHDKTEMSQNN